MIFNKGYFEKVFEKGAAWGYSTSSYERVKYARQLEVMKRFAPGAKGILEVGCAEGIHTAMMAAAFPAAKICCVDISLTALQKARVTCQDYANLGLVEGDIIELVKRRYFAPGSFDIVVQSECLYYLFPKLAVSLNLYRYLRDMAGLLSQDGIFVTANGISGATGCVMPVYYAVLRRFCDRVYDGKHREWNDYRNKYMTYELKVFRRVK